MRRRYLAFLIVVAASIAAVVTSFAVVGTISSTCHGTQKQWQVLHDVIVQQNATQKPSPLLLRLLPEFKPFFTPGNPSYDEAQRIAHVRTDAVLNKLGPEPTC